MNNTEEGGDDVKSSWPLRVGLHTCYNGRYRWLRKRELELIPKSLPQSGLESATRLHEVGIASNRGSARHGEFVPEPWTPCPSHCGSVFDFKNIREIKKNPKKWKLTSFFFFFDLSPNISQ